MIETPTLILTRGDVAALMTPADYVEAVRRGFLALAEGRADSPAPLHLHAGGGGIHAKGALVRGAHAAIKINGNFPHNPQASGLPTIQGVMMLADATNGRVLAVMDSVEVTLRRTAAASAIAVQACAPQNARVVAVCGAGVQGRAQLEAIAAARKLAEVRVWDQDREKAAQYAAEMSERLQLPVAAKSTAAAAVDGAIIVLACTSARHAYLHPANIRPGTFIAAVGADNPDKSEITPALMATADVVTDVTAQCIVMGDLHHAIGAGLMTAADVRAELADIVTGRKTVRCGSDQIVIFDSTGAAIQDVASASLVYERALARGAGTWVDFLSSIPVFPAIRRA